MPVAQGGIRDAKYRRALEQYQQRPNQLLAGQDVVYGAIGEAPSYEWLVPKGRPFPSDLRGFIQDTQLQLIGQDVFPGGGAPGESPDYDYPVPKGPQPHRENRTFLHRVDLPLIGQDAIYGAAGQAPEYIWVVPPGPLRAMELRTHIHATDRHLIGQDTIYGAPGQAPVYDTSLPPRGRPMPIENRTWTQSIVDMFFVLITLPFNQMNWPVPWGRAPHRENRTHLTNITRMIGQDRMYGAPGQVPSYDWQVPTPPRPRSRELRSWLHSMDVQTLTDTVAVVATFVSSISGTFTQASISGAFKQAHVVGSFVARTVRGVFKSRDITGGFH